MSSPRTYLSVCSGISAASIAWAGFGWQACAFAEVDPFAAAVLKHHWPHVPNLGDLTQYHDWPRSLRPHILEGGTPCQGFSVAGLRGGLDDPRSQLMLTYVELAALYRPAWLVWENVPGVLSSNGGADFAAFLGALTGRRVPIPPGGWQNAGTLEGIPSAYGIAWRTLDAQHFGVPQRRRRVFLVGHLGDWRPAAAVLFEPESLRGDPPPRREPGQRPAGTLTKSAIGSGSAGGGDGRDSFFVETALTLRGEGHDASEDGTGRGTPLVPCIAPAVTSKWAKGSGGPSGDECQNLVACQALSEPLAFDCKASGQNGFGIGDIAPTLRSMAHKDTHQNGGGQIAVAFNLRGREGGAMPEVDPDGLACQRAASGGSSRSYVAAWDESLNVREDDGIGALTRGGDGGPHHGVMTGTAVRRLTPRECERLQGFPDNHTFIPIPGAHKERKITKNRPADRWQQRVDGKWQLMAADGPRYKALGNSMAVPVMRWIGSRIHAFEALPT